MKLLTLPPHPHVEESFRLDRGEGHWTVTCVNKKTKVRRVTWTEGGEMGMITREVWTCDHLPGREFGSYDLLREAYNGGKRK